ncbi:GAF domain-containing sensor histidine kinase [Iningainema tapete]|uniref:PAS domain S-box protein n=1 Tax=Iningainema tapete BLCC-T55 TaxID=2748662 RepID=A0A8J7C0C4_9CYAN|nr:GAF domain-containing sensor histidine kinase [Iningainema tapete]MBD2777783.1 PAS domain S-box protein [Iningainema tapete BLCC-T55]
MIQNESTNNPAEQERAALLEKANQLLQAEVAMRRLLELVRSSEQRFRTMFEQAAVGMVLANLEGQWLQVNQRFCDITGYTKSEMLQMSFGDITHPDTLSTDLEATHQLREGAITQYQTQKRYIRKDGSLIWVHLTVSLCRDDLGKPSCFIGIIQDISQGKEAELVAQGQQAALGHTLNLLATQPELDKFLEQVLITCTEQLRERASTLWLYDAATLCNSLHMTCYDGKVQRKPFPWIGEGETLTLSVQNWAAWQQLIHTRRPVIVTDLAKNLHEKTRNWMSAEGVKSLLVVPLLFNEEIVGTFGIHNTKSNYWQPEAIELAQALAQQATLAIQLTRLAEEAKQAALLEERNRLASEIHDTLAQTFTGISIQLELAKFLVHQNPAEAEQILNRIGELAQTGLDEARRSVWTLYPATNEYADLAQTLSDSVAQMTKGTAIHTEVKIHGNPYPLLPFIGKNLLRIAQEAITNALKHAQATTLWIELTYESACIYLCVRDNGCGFSLATNTNGFGLISMSERVDRIGGQLTITSHPGEGTEILVHVPIR